MKQPRRPTFYKWIANFKDVDLPIGDLARDTLEVTDFPKSNKYEIILDYITIKSNNNTRVLEVFNEVWDFYVKST